MPIPFRTSFITMMLVAWSTLALAQTPPGGGTTSPSGTTTSANPGDVAGSGLTWLWVIIAVVVIAALLFYFLGRGRSTRV